MTSQLLDHDRTGPIGAPRVLLLHAGVADRRMWQEMLTGPVSLTDDHDILVPDLRGFGRSDHLPTAPWTHAGDVAQLVDARGAGQVHVVGASLGAGVAAELALDRPDLVASLLLLTPGGSLIPRMTEQLRAFAAAENAALEADDLDTACAANVDWWLVGPSRTADQVALSARDLVHAMQRRAFEIIADWPDLEQEPDRPPLDRLSEIGVPTLVLTGGLDLDVITEAAEAVVAGIPGARRADWPDTAHLPALERPDDLAALVRSWLWSHDPRGAHATCLDA